VSGGVTISATFGKKESVRNGLDALAEDFAHEQPPERHYVVGVIECIRVNINRAKGDEETPAVRFVAIEAALSETDVKALRTVFERRYKARTGNAPQPELPAADDDAEG